MKSMADIYADSLHEHFKVLYPTWPPGESIKLGDFGEMHDNVFVRRGNIMEGKNISFKERLDDTKDDYDFKSAESTKVNFSAKGSTSGGVINAKASLNIEFSSQESVFFNAADCEHHSIENQVDVGKRIMKLFENNEWDEDHAIVTSFIKAGATTVIISGGKQSSISLEASSDKVEQINLGDAGINLNVKTENSIGLRLVTQTGLLPLMGLMKIQSKFLIWGHKWGPLTHSLMQENALAEAVKKDASSKQDLYYFGQLTSSAAVLPNLPSSYKHRPDMKLK